MMSLTNSILVILLVVIAVGCGGSKSLTGSDTLSMTFHGAKSESSLTTANPLASQPAETVSVTIAGEEVAMATHPQSYLLGEGETAIRVHCIHLKNREYHPANQAELRRAQARKIASDLKRASGEAPDMPQVVFVEAFDELDSAPMKALAAEGWEVIRPVDAAGHAWTHHESEADSYHRWSFALLNDAANARLKTSKIEPSQEKDRPRKIALEFSK